LDGLFLSVTPSCSSRGRTGHSIGANTSFPPFLEEEQYMLYLLPILPGIQYEQYRIHLLPIISGIGKVKTKPLPSFL
jgi:hypothetical protein